MMNRIFKGGLIVLALSTVFVPRTLAVEQPVNQKAFCERLSTAAATAESTLTKKVDAVKAARAAADTKRTELRAGVDGSFDTKRAEADAKRDDALAKLLESAKNDTQKTAVQTFTDAVKKAMSDRREANDAARMTFRQAVDVIIMQHRSDTDAQVSDFVSKIRTAGASAKSACTSNNSNAATGFKQAVKTAKADFLIDRAADVKVGEQIKAVAAMRNASIKANDATAKATIDAAREVLKAALES